MSIFSMEEVATLRRLMSRLETFVGVFSKEEVDTLCQLMSQLETFFTTSSFLAHTGDLTTALNASATPSDDSWIIDFGASNHMTGRSCFLLIIFVQVGKMLELPRALYHWCLVKAPFLSHLLCHCRLFFIHQILQPIYCPLLVLPMS
jgi:hypothetical protein